MPGRGHAWGFIEEKMVTPPALGRLVRAVKVNKLGENLRVLGPSSSLLRQGMTVQR